MNKDFKDLPVWLQKLWELAPAIAREAENYLTELEEKAWKYDELCK